MTEGDLDEVLSIEKESEFSPWSRKNFVESLKYTKNRTQIVFLNEVVGYCVSSFVEDELNIEKLVVKSNMRRKGIGRLLLTNMIIFCTDNNLSKVFLEVRENNVPAVALYSSLGFVTKYVRKKYYRPNNENALVMVKQIERY